MAHATTASTPLPAALAAAVAESDRIKTRAIDLAAYASDASHYLLTPNAVIVAADSAEIARILAAASLTGSGITFRSGGTSLSGQSSGDGVLIDVRQRFGAIEVLDGGRLVQAQPGATVRQVNARLAPYGYRLGPDPASEVACTVGGVVANNSSGMACGIEENTYRTLESMIFVLPSGTTVDTAAQDADAALRRAEPELVNGLERLRRRVLADPASVARIRSQFALKNTMGYGINAFLDFERPVDLLAHLIIGSEGTLAFVAEATFRTVKVHSLVSTSIAVFPTIESATTALPDLVASSAATLELMDAASLRVGQGLAGAPDDIIGFRVEQHAALLVEYRSDDAAELAALAAAGEHVLAAQPLRGLAQFREDAASRSRAWAFRKGLYASVAGARPSGTTALLEDVVVPVPALAATCRSLQDLFARYSYADSVIFGHAKDGNIHFMLTDRFEGDEALRRYLSFTEEMVEAVLAAGGNLKAEHGTGRAMAPYVRRQYGDELYAVMRELKSLCDPVGIMNPGVIIDEDMRAHVTHIKLPLPIEEEADRCVECGYCEPACPSRNLTLTPRQRIVVRRAEKAARERGDHELADELDRQYQYDGVETCAVDGMCQTACPVLINTGTLVKRLRREDASPVAKRVWQAAASEWGAATRIGSAALTAVKHVPAPIIRVATSVGRAVLGADAVPEYSAELPRGGLARRRMRPRVGAPDTEPMAAYVPACVNSMFGPAGDGLGVSSAFTRLLERAGIALAVPEGVESMCCGTPWSSKGFVDGYAINQRRTVAAVRMATGDGALPVIVDASSCTEGFVNLLKGQGIQVEDAVAFTVREILPRVSAVPIVDSLVLHPTCSSAQMGLDPQLRAIGMAVARNVIVPQSWGCCAFAGDRGMLHPELTESATQAEAAEVRAVGADAHASCNRTCELGMTRATGEEYSHVIELLERATRRSETGLGAARKGQIR
ncbi:FAD-binding and (Fe-S)-binding domain-containing protein [Luethyella okanaganae]|uniref:D-lactate dehydrogenase (cytochrome) n=1 Tax=Luethyella okanaganae TaxID=69372 RepID=A0ABW1VFK0_9MICO